MPTRRAGEGDRTEDADSKQDLRPGEDSRHGDRHGEHAVAEQRNGGRPNTGTGTAPKMRTAPQSIAKPGRNRNLPGLLCISVVLPDGHLREWAVPMLCDPRLRPVAYVMRL